MKTIVYYSLILLILLSIKKYTISKINIECNTAYIKALNLIYLKSQISTLNTTVTSNVILNLLFILTADI